MVYKSAKWPHSEATAFVLLPLLPALPSQNPFFLGAFSVTCCLELFSEALSAAVHYVLCSCFGWQSLKSTSFYVSFNQKTVFNQSRGFAFPRNQFVVVTLRGSKSGGYCTNVSVCGLDGSLDNCRKAEQLDHWVSAVTWTSLSCLPCLRQ